MEPKKRLTILIVIAIILVIIAVTLSILDSKNVQTENPATGNVIKSSEGGNIGIVISQQNVEDKGNIGEPS
ncbi:MAG: hypothetical protein ABIF88_01470 [archaeon]